MNNQFGTKVKFEQVTDSKALKDLMIKKAKKDQGDQVSEEVQKFWKQKEKELQQYEEQIKNLK